MVQKTDGLGTWNIHFKMCVFLVGWLPIITLKNLWKLTISIHYWLVVSNIFQILHLYLGEDGSNLTTVIFFQMGWLKPPTSALEKESFPPRDEFSTKSFLVEEMRLNKKPKVVKDTRQGMGTRSQRFRPLIPRCCPAPPWGSFRNLEPWQARWWRRRCHRTGCLGRRRRGSCGHSYWEGGVQAKGQGYLEVGPLPNGRTSWLIKKGFLKLYLLTGMILQAVLET